MQTRYLVVAFKKTAYSLVELLVVLGIITLLAIVGIPNLFGSNERYALDNTARKVEQLITDARTRSIAPAGNTSNGSAQVFQVTFSDFPDNPTSENKVTAMGDIRTNTATLQSGIASCGTSSSQGGVTNLKTLNFPRNVFVSSFYPTNQSPTQKEATIRFSIGKVGFQCGNTEDPLDSTDLTSPYWSGVYNSGLNTLARYFVIEISSTRIGEKRYVAIDRLNSETIVSRTNPQSSFIPYIDTFAPLWRDTPTATFRLTCRAEKSEIEFSFARAVDPAKTGDTVATADPNRIVYYDIHWKQGSAGVDEFQPLASKHFSPLTQDTVRFIFNTGAVTTSNQPTPIVFRAWAIDGFGNYSASKDFTFNRPNDWDCGNNGGGNNCVSKLPTNRVTYRPVVMNDPFELRDNPCTSDTNDGTGNSDQGEVLQAPLAAPSI